MKKASVKMGNSEVVNCPEHGPYEARECTLGSKTFRMGCPACVDQQIAARSAAVQAEQSRERGVAAQRLLERRLAGVMIPARFANKSFETYVVTLPEQKFALAEVRAYADGFEGALASGRCLLLLGPSGTGKTHLATSVANQIVRQGYTALFRTVQEVIRHVRSSWGRSEKTEAEAIAELVAPDLLILDEVGVQYGKAGELVTLFDVMNARYSACKPCIVISNLSLAELPDFLDERVVDRLREAGGQAIPFDWEAARKQRGEPHGS